MLTPWADNDRAAPRPMAPPPITSAVFAEPCNASLASLTVCQPHAIGSARDAASSDTWSGTVTRFSPRIAINCAKAPSRGGMEMIIRSGHRLSRPDLQAGHVPQETNGLTVTRSPSRGPPTITPAASCPRINGAGRRSSWPRYACISEPQTPTDITLIKC